MKPREAMARAIRVIAESGSGARAGLVDLLEAYIAEDREELEGENDPTKIYRLQGRVQLAREILKSITSSKME
jgi:hypothetical protein